MAYISDVWYVIFIVLLIFIAIDIASPLILNAISSLISEIMRRMAHGELLPPVALVLSIVGSGATIWLILKSAIPSSIIITTSTMFSSMFKKRCGRRVRKYLRRLVTPLLNPHIYEFAPEEKGLGRGRRVVRK